MFRSCPSVEEISFLNPNEITELYLESFYECQNLREINIPNSVTKIGNSCFMYCISLISISIPHLVTNLGSYCFGHCTNLTIISLPDKINYIGDYCFSFCTSLNEIDCHSCQYFGSSCFRDCMNLRKFSLKNESFTISSFMFMNDINLAYFDGVRIVSIEEYGFSHCNSITDEIIKNVTRLGSNSLECCHDITTIPKKMISIGDFAFCNCKLSKTIYIPLTVESIGRFAFRSTSIEIVHYCGSTDFSNIQSIFESDTIKVYVTNKYQFDTFCGFKVIRKQSCNFAILTEDYNPIQFAVGSQTRLIRRSNL